MYAYVLLVRQMTFFRACQRQILSMTTGLRGCPRGGEVEKDSKANSKLERGQVQIHDDINTEAGRQKGKRIKSEEGKNGRWSRCGHREQT